MTPVVWPASRAISRRSAPARPSRSMTLHAASAISSRRSSWFTTRGILVIITGVIYNDCCVKTGGLCGFATQKGAAKMAWGVLGGGGVFEGGEGGGRWCSGGASEGFTKLWGSLVMVVSGGISFYLLSVAMQSIPAGTAYAVWTAIGASLAVLLGILFLGEPANMLRLVGIIVVLGGVLVLRFAEG